MSSLKKLLLWILCAGVAGSAQAIEPSASASLGTLSPAVKTQVADSGSYAGAGSMSVLPDKERPMEGSRSGLKVAFSAGDYPARTTVNAGAGPREGSRLREAPVPEPSEWMQLLCGLAFVAFVARRRTQPPTG